MNDGWLDVHAHFSAPGNPEQVRALWQAMRDDCFLMPEPYVWAAERALDHMDETGIAMQMLSQVPRTHGVASSEVHGRISASNRFGAQVVAAHPDRFGLLAALPTDSIETALAELHRTDALEPDGYLLEAPFAGVHLGATFLEPLWDELEARARPVLVHPDSHAPAAQGRPSPLAEVAFSTARSAIDMIYAGVLLRHPRLVLILAHAGGAFPAMTGRLGLLGTEVWVPNPNRVTQEQMAEQISRLYLDTAASSADTLLWPAVRTVGEAHLIYGSDTGTPCTSEPNVETVIAQLRASTALTPGAADAAGRRGFEIFPDAARRASGSLPG
jgi:6-methylsalicylate decarboxylase